MGRRYAWRKSLTLNVVLLMGLVVVGSSCLGDNASEHKTGEAPMLPYGIVSTSDTLTLIQANQDNLEFVILDLRTDREFGRGHIAGAINLNYYAKTFKQDLKQLDKEMTYLIYCQRAKRSAKAAQTMEELGFTRVYELDGGISRWQKEGLKTCQCGLDENHRCTANRLQTTNTRS